MTMRSHHTAARAGIAFALTVLLSFTFTAASQEKDPGHPKLDNPLNAVAEAFGQSGAAGAQTTAQSQGLTPRSGGRLAVILEPKGTLGASSINVGEVVRRGGQVDAVSRSFMRVLVPYGSLQTLADHPDIKIARVPTPAVESAMGSNVSESVGLTGAANVQLSGITGVGVKVAVVDLGFIGLADAINLGELPAGTVAVDYTGSGVEASTAHGVGVAEHVMDMAPGVELHCLKVGDEVDLQNAADYCWNNGISVANHSVGWVLGSYYDGTGPINSIINDSRLVDGVFWALAVGNAAQRHWRGGWNDGDGDAFLEFSGSDERLGLTTTSGVAYIFLNWDQYGNSVTDLDLRVLDRRGTVVASSTGSQTGTQPPTEAVGFMYNSRRDPYSIIVNVFSGPTGGLDMTIFSFYNNLEYAIAANSMMDPANAPGAFSVGAIWQADWGGSDAPEPYSSQGPTNDGRQKPEIIAPDGTTSLTYGFQGSFGTSFSSPTTAGAAALLFSEDLTRTAADVENLLRAMAEDVVLGAEVGWDPVYGHGKLHLDSTFSNAAPVAWNDGPFNVAEDSSATTLFVLANDTDDDDDPLTVTGVTAPANGQSAVTDGGLTVSYEPDPNFFGADSFDYTISDGKGGTDSATVSVNVTAVNDPPTADDQAVGTVQNTSVNITLTGSDLDGDSITFTVLTQPGHGTLSGAEPNLTYDPDFDYTGSDSFTFEADDGNGGTDTGIVTISVDSPPPPSVITLTVDLVVRKNSATAKLNWSGANSENIDIYRNGVLIATKSNNGKYNDRLSATGTYTYQVCEAGTATCSNEVSVLYE